MVGATTRKRPPRARPAAAPLPPTPSSTQLIARALHLAQTPTPRPHPDAQAALATALGASASPAAFVADLLPLLSRAARVWERAPAVEAVFANVTVFAAANAGDPLAGGGADRGDDASADEDGKEGVGGPGPIVDSVASRLLLAVASWTAAADRAVRFRGAQAAGAILDALDDGVVFDGEVYEQLTDALVAAASDVVVRVRAAAAVALCRLQVVDSVDGELADTGGEDGTPNACPVHALLAELATGDASPVVRAAAVSSVIAVGIGAVALRTALRDGCPGVRRSAVAAMAAVNPVALGGDGRAAALVTFLGDPDAGVRAVGWSRVVVGAWFRGACEGDAVAFAELLLRDELPPPPTDGDEAGGEGGMVAPPVAAAASDGAGWDDDAVTPPPTPARTRLVLATLTRLFRDPAAAPTLAVDVNDLAEADALVLRAVVAVRGTAALTPLIRDAGVLADVLVYYAGLPRVLVQLLPLVGAVARGGREALRSVLLESIIGGEGVDGSVVGAAVEAMRELEGAGRGDEAVLEYTLAEVLPAAAAAAAAAGGTAGDSDNDDDAVDEADTAAATLCRRRASWARLRALHIADAVMGGAPSGLLFPTAKPRPPPRPPTPPSLAGDATAADVGASPPRDTAAGGLTPVSPPRRPAADADGPSAAVARLLVRLAIASVGGASAPDDPTPASPADDGSAGAARAAALRVLGQAALADPSGRTASEAAPLLVTAARYEAGAVAADATRSLCDLLVKFGDLDGGGGGKGGVLLGASLVEGGEGGEVFSAGDARSSVTDTDDEGHGSGCTSDSESDASGAATRSGSHRTSRRVAGRRGAMAATADAPAVDDLAAAAVEAAAAGAAPGSATAAALSQVLVAATSTGVARRAVGGEAAAKLLLTRRIPASAATPVLAWLAVSPHVVRVSPPRGGAVAAAAAAAATADDAQWHPDAAHDDPAARLRSVTGVLFALYVRRGAAAAAAVEAAAIQVATAVAASAAMTAAGGRRSGGGGGGGGGGWGVDAPTAIATVTALCALLQRTDNSAARRGDGAAGGGARDGVNGEGGCDAGGPVARIATAVVGAAAAGLGGVAGVRLLCRLAGGLRPAVAGASAGALRAAVAAAVEGVAAEGGGGARAAGNLRRLLALCEAGGGGGV